MGILKDPSSLILLRPLDDIDGGQDAQAANDRNDVRLKRKRRQVLGLNAQMNIPISRKTIKSATCIEIAADYSLQGFDARRKVQVTPLVGIKRCARHKKPEPPPPAHEGSADVESPTIKPGEGCSDLFNQRKNALSEAVVINPPSVQIKSWYGDG
ncbi:hypothetical protein KP509_14G018000 [Ceratopteris richardii]|uniref:Uncharacterized protein n=1 Tax=Ceratopteris richardii TaxID=49495 RepID=A0A8T2T7H1_CERRI|nr:hypothetical protein KP509_14G018000 [Ceratopteris richardii]